MKMKRILLFFLFIFSTENGFAQIIAPENPGASGFPGGYISLAIQWGKNNNGVSFRSYQATAGIALPNSDNIQTFIGLTVGKRKLKNDTEYDYYDLQLSISPIAGLGIGKAKLDGNFHNRIKGWLGLGPLIYSGDWLYLPDEKIANGGFMVSLPVTVVFGNQFSP